jgi:Leucine-rich repeat (LRR) protein
MNQIREIRKDTFNGLFSLKLLNLTNNSISKIQRMNNDLINLEFLYLSHNNLNNFYPTMFAGMKNIQIFTVSHNNLAYLHSETFKLMSKLQRIDLSNNKIVIIQEKEFNKIPSLVSIDLKNNNIEMLYFNLIQGCLKLINICLFGNSFPQNILTNNVLNYTGLMHLNTSSIWDAACQI